MTNRKTNRKPGITIPKSIRNEVKSLFKNAKSSNIQVSLVIVDENTGRSLTTTSGAEYLHNLIDQATGNYSYFRTREYNAFVAGQESVAA